MHVSVVIELIQNQKHWDSAYLRQGTYVLPVSRYGSGSVCRHTDPYPYPYLDR